MKISEQFFFMKENGSMKLGRFPARHIRKILEPSGSIQVYYQRSNSTLIEKGIPSGILFFSIHEGENNPIAIDNDILNTDNCTCKVNIYKKHRKYIMKIKQVKEGE